MELPVDQTAWKLLVAVPCGCIHCTVHRMSRTVLSSVCCKGDLYAMQQNAAVHTVRICKLSQRHWMKQRWTKSSAFIYPWSSIMIIESVLWLLMSTKLPLSLHNRLHNRGYLTEIFTQRGNLTHSIIFTNIWKVWYIHQIILLYNYYIIYYIILLFNLSSNLHFLDYNEVLYYHKIIDILKYTYINWKICLCMCVQRLQVKSLTYNV